MMVMSVLHTYFESLSSISDIFLGNGMISEELNHVFPGYILTQRNGCEIPHHLIHSFSTSEMSFSKGIIDEFKSILCFPRGGRGVHDLRMDGSLPPGLKKGTLF